MDQAQLNGLTNFIWNIADDVLRDIYVRGRYAAKIDDKQSVVEYEPDSELRDHEQIPLLEEGGVEAFIRREVLPYYAGRLDRRGRHHDPLRNQLYPPLLPAAAAQQPGRHSGRYPGTGADDRRLAQRNHRRDDGVTPPSLPYYMLPH